MAEFPALPLWTDAYLGDTTHLDATEHGAYLLLLMISWRTRETAVPDDDATLARYARCTMKVWRRVRPVLEPFFEISDGKWVQLRLRDEKLHVVTKREIAAANGRASALKRKGRHSTERITERKQTDQQNGNKPATPTPTPTPSLKEEGASAPSKKGTRIAENFAPGPLPQSVALLVAEWPEGREQRELEGFIGYWKSRSSQATKLDWDATWHNRIRDQHDRIMRENRNGQQRNGIRGSRPDPAVDLWNAANRAEQDETRQIGGGPGLSLPAPERE